ncbi:hypothetical protein [uncultured Psychromonas sp.]|uniref:hypothetical protein n=1 Tax=uncultured Psychromonas sp. TaxID=173974 RepID=UPI002616DE3D|nr:hypothetical protein [uncultured Psychromonas sp.]
MYNSLPITVVADQTFSSVLSPLIKKLEMWINFQALKANWYEDERIILSINFMLVKTIEEKQLTTEHWVVDTGIAYQHQGNNLNTQALIAIADLVKLNKGIEQAIKNRLIQVANAIAKQHQLTPLA